MDVLSLDGVRIAGVAACLPATVVPNDDKIAQATGIRSRRLATVGMTVVDLCTQAALRVLADTETHLDEIGAILCVSFTQTNRMPCAAVEAQARLGLPKGVIAFDVTLACSGWGYGLYLAGLLARQTGKKVLLLDGDVQSAFQDAKNAATQPLLSDAGTATLVEPHAKTDEPWRFAFIADGEKGGALRLAHGGTIEMDGFGVFRFVATDVVGYLKDFLSTVALANDFVFVPHQPNAYMVRQLAKSVGIPDGKTAISCDEIGNPSSASVPTTLAWKGVRGNVLFAGFGGGLSVSIGTVRVEGPLSIVEI